MNPGISTEELYAVSRYVKTNRRDKRNFAKGYRWQDFYRAGREIEELLNPMALMTFQEIAPRVGCRNFQQCHIECRIALGKIALALRREFPREVQT